MENGEERAEELSLAGNLAIGATCGMDRFQVMAGKAERCALCAEASGPSGHAAPKRGLTQLSKSPLAPLITV